MSTSNLTVARWERRDGKPGSHGPLEALEVARHRVESGEWEAEHVIVICGHVDEDGAIKTAFTQAGSFDCYGQFGLLGDTQRLFWQD